MKHRGAQILTLRFHRPEHWSSHQTWLAKQNERLQRNHDAVGETMCLRRRWQLKMMTKEKTKSKEETEPGQTPPSPIDPPELTPKRLRFGAADCRRPTGPVGAENCLRLLVEGLNTCAVAGPVGAGWPPRPEGVADRPQPGLELADGSEDAATEEAAGPGEEIPNSVPAWLVVVAPRCGADGKNRWRIRRPRDRLSSSLASNRSAHCRCDQRYLVTFHQGLWSRSWRWCRRLCMNDRHWNWRWLLLDGRCCKREAGRLERIILNRRDRNRAKLL
eukprot:scaffold7675_cov147-Cylindrotheca_fusiformis.AAC.2